MQYEEPREVVYVPAEHMLHNLISVCPDFEVYVPLGQKEQFKTPVPVLYVPLEQTKHPTDPYNELYVPGRHCKQEADVSEPKNELNVPGRH